VVQAFCIFEINGERWAEGDLQLEKCLESSLLTVKCPTEFAAPLELTLSKEQCIELREFFNDPEILFWKLLILNFDSSIDTTVTLSFAREPNLTLHLSIAAGLDSRHFETSLSIIGMDLQKFF
jgi:hypothetical protein